MKIDRASIQLILCLLVLSFLLAPAAKPITALVQCSGTLLSRLSVGMQGRVASVNGTTTRLRSGAGTNHSILREMPEGTQFTVLSGPECGTYAWWQIQLADGTVGWSAEAGNGTYFLEPANSGQLSGMVMPMRSDCGDASSTRLAGVEIGRNATGQGETNVRSTPGGQSIYRMIEGETFVILDGPVCQQSAGGSWQNWWLIRLDDGTEGYAPEGRQGVYWLEPVIASEQAFTELSSQLLGRWEAYYPDGSDPFYSSHPYPSLNFCIDGTVDFPGISNFRGTYEFVDRNSIRFYGYEGSEHGVAEQPSEWLATVALNNGLLMLTSFGSTSSYVRTGDGSCTVDVSATRENLIGVWQYEVENDAVNGIAFYPDGGVAWALAEGDIRGTYSLISSNEMSMDLISVGYETITRERYYFSYNVSGDTLALSGGFSSDLSLVFHRIHWFGPNELAKCSDTIANHIVGGFMARASFSSATGLELRTQPSVQAAVEANLVAGAPLLVLAGPHCGDGYTWWQVEVRDGGATGWIAEGSDGQYFFEPIPIPHTEQITVEGCSLPSSTTTVDETLYRQILSACWNTGQSLEHLQAVLPQLTVAFLNYGTSADRLGQLLHDAASSAVPFPDAYALNLVESGDLTGTGGVDVVANFYVDTSSADNLQYPGITAILLQRNGVYELAYTDTFDVTFAENIRSIVSVQDLNADGRDEIIEMSINAAASTNWTSLRILGWNNFGVISRVSEEAEALPTAELDISDNDGDGIYSLALTGGGVGSGIAQIPPGDDPYLKTVVWVYDPTSQLWLVSYPNSAEAELPSELGMFVVPSSGTVQAREQPSFQSPVQYTLQQGLDLLAPGDIDPKDWGLIIDGPYEGDGTTWWLAIFPEGTQGFLPADQIRPAVAADIMPLDRAIEAVHVETDYLELLLSLRDVAELNSVKNACTVIAGPNMMLSELDYQSVQNTTTTIRDFCTAAGLLSRHPYLEVASGVDEVLGISETAFRNLIRSINPGATLTCETYPTDYHCGRIRTGFRVPEGMTAIVEAVGVWRSATGGNIPDLEFRPDGAVTVSSTTQNYGSYQYLDPSLIVLILPDTRYECAIQRAGTMRCVPATNNQSFLLDRIN